MMWVNVNVIKLHGIDNIIPCFCNLDNFDKFRYLMNCSETDVLNRFLLFIDKCILEIHQWE